MLTLDNPCGHLWILLCPTPDDFTRPRGKCLGSSGLNKIAIHSGKSVLDVMEAQMGIVFTIKLYNYIVKRLQTRILEVNMHSSVTIEYVPNSFLDSLAGHTKSRQQACNCRQQPTTSL